MACARRFSALQRAEIAEMVESGPALIPPVPVSVLFNEPKLLKCLGRVPTRRLPARFSALQRAEIAEIVPVAVDELAE